MSWYGFRARLDALVCILRGHAVQWRTNVDEVCSGDIICETCDLLIWCRGLDEMEDA